MNKGIIASTGQYLMFLNSDDWLNVKNIMSTRNCALKHYRDFLAAMYISRFQDYPDNFDKTNIVCDSLRYFTLCIDINAIPNSLKTLYFKAQDLAFNILMIS